MDMLILFVYLLAFAVALRWALWRARATIGCGACDSCSVGQARRKEHSLLPQEARAPSAANRERRQRRGRTGAT
jgi:hypothetical protein